MKFNRLICCVLCVCFLTGLLPAQAQATYADGRFSFELLPDNTAKITHFQDKRYATKTLTVPEKVAGYTVTAIGKFAFMASELTHITLPDTVKTIDEFAFCNALSLQEINLSASLQSIGAHAFSSCTSLKSITLPDNVTFSGNGAFGDCISLTEVIIPESVVSLPERTFSGCLSLERVFFLGDVDTVGEACFFSCVSLKDVVFDGTVRHIEKAAFSNCKQLQYFSFPDGLISIGQEAFHSSGLQAVAVPDSLKTLGSGAFIFCENLQSAVLGSGLTAIEAEAFKYCTTLQTVALPDTLESIGSGAFECCFQLTRMDLPAKLTAIGDNAFHSTGIQRLLVPAGVENVNGNTFPAKVKLIVVKDSPAESYCIAHDVAHEAIGMSANSREANACFNKKAHDPETEVHDTVQSMLNREAAAVFLETADKVSASVQQGGSYASGSVQFYYALTETFDAIKNLTTSYDERMRETMKAVIIQAMIVSVQENDEALKSYAELLNGFVTRAGQSMENASSAVGGAMSAVEFSAKYLGTELDAGSLGYALTLLELLFKSTNMLLATAQEQKLISELAASYQLSMEFLEGLQSVTPTDSLIYTLCDEVRDMVTKRINSALSGYSSGVLEGFLKIFFDFGVDYGAGVLAEKAGSLALRGILLVGTAANLLSLEFDSYIQAQETLIYMRNIHQETEGLLRWCYQNNSDALYYSAILHNAAQRYGTECAYACLQQFGTTAAEAQSAQAKRMLSDVMDQYRAGVSDRISLDRAYFACIKSIQEAALSFNAPIVVPPGGRRIAVDFEATIFLREDGTAAYTGDQRRNQHQVSEWKDIVEVATGRYLSAGLTKEGKVYVADFYQHKTPVMSHVVQLSAGFENVLGVKDDGTVENYGTHVDLWDCHVNACGWQNVMQADTNDSSCVGITYDGKLLVEGLYINEQNQYVRAKTYTELKMGGTGARPVQVSLGESHIVVLKEDGTVWVNGNGGDTSGWRNIVQVSGGYGCTVGLKDDGTLVVAYGQFVRHDYDSILSWSNVQQVAISTGHVVALLNDGTLVATGFDVAGQCNVQRLMN